MSNLPYPAPDVQLPSNGDQTIDLADFRPSAVVLFFYPRDNTSGCTKEAQAFSALQSSFKKIGVEIVGISKNQCTVRPILGLKGQLFSSMGKETL